MYNKKMIITQEQFEIYMYNDMPYEGFVDGIGYVLPEVTVYSNEINQYYKTEEVAQNQNYNVFIFRENIEKVNGVFNNSAKGMHFGLNQRYQLPSPKFLRGAPVTGIVDTHAGRIKDGIPVGDWVIRVDEIHKGAKSPHPHININPMISGIPDPHTNISMNTLKRLKITGKTFTVVGKIAKPVAIISDGVKILSALEKDGGSIGKNTVVASSEVAGGWTGALVGAKLGATSGAAIGTFFAPGLGTAIGGFVGAIGFSIAGAFGGSWIGEKTSSSVYDALNE